MHRFAEPNDHIELCDLGGGAGCGTQAAANLFPSLVEDDVDGVLSNGMARNLLGTEHSFKLAHEIGRADDLLAERTNKFNRSGIDHGDVHDVVVRRVLHGDALEPESMASRRVWSSCQLE